MVTATADALKGQISRGIADIFQRSETQEIIAHRRLTVAQKNSEIARLLSFKERKAFKSVGRLGEHYRIRRELGAGNFGSVKLGEHVRSGVTCAIKIIKKSHEMLYE